MIADSEANYASSDWFDCPYLFRQSDAECGVTGYEIRESFQRPARQPVWVQQDFCRIRFVWTLLPMTG
jgi:hypothetical protein